MLLPQLHVSYIKLACWTKIQQHFLTLTAAGISNFLNRECFFFFLLGVLECSNLLHPLNYTQCCFDGCLLIQICNAEMIRQMCCRLTLSWSANSRSHSFCQILTPIIQHNSIIIYYWTNKPYFTVNTLKDHWVEYSGIYWQKWNTILIIVFSFAYNHLMG